MATAFATVRMRVTLSPQAKNSVNGGFLKRIYFNVTFISQFTFQDSLKDFILDYFLSILVDNRRIIKSTKGTPIKTTQGTNVSVRNNVF